MFPNPAKDRLTITSTKELRRVSVLTMDGRVVMMRPVRSGTVEMDVSQLANGSYVLGTTDADAHVFHHRFIKQ